MTKRYISYGIGIAVTEQDAAALETDKRLFGTAYVENLGGGYGRRINPQDIHISAVDGETTIREKPDAR